jgi:hypothetical protein
VGREGDIDQEKSSAAAGNGKAKEKRSPSRYTIN